MAYKITLYLYLSIHEPLITLKEYPVLLTHSCITICSYLFPANDCLLIVHIPLKYDQEGLLS